MALSTLEKIRIALDIAQAMAFAHSRAQPVLHRDLKTTNVLVRVASVGV
jgi:serine/threonine protein kinase